MALSLLVLPAAQPAFADAPMTTTPLPAITMGSNGAGVLAHGNGNFTAITQECPGYKNSTDTAAISAITHDGGVANSIKKLDGAFQTQPCVDWMVAGADSTSYVVQVASNYDGISYYYRLVAARDNMILWAKAFVETPACGKRNAYIKSPRLGKDGNIYAVLLYNSLNSCPAKEVLVSISSATGAELWRSADLPVADANNISTATGLVFVHDGGVAVRSGKSVYFYDYDGTAQTSATFSPPAASNTSMPFVSIMPATGRVYLVTDTWLASTNSNVRHLYYKDMAGSTTEITVPAGTLIGEPFAAPNNGFVLQTGSTSSSPGFNYYDADGSLLYSRNLSTGETGMSFTGEGFGIIVDNLGNVITRRTFYVSSGTQDKNVQIDEFSPTGVKTRLFNSSSLGTSGFESFTAASQMRQNIGGGKLYFVLCRRTDAYGSTCNSLYNPVIVQLTVSASGDYARYAAFSAQVGGTNRNYVALGDSYSSGEGIPAANDPKFIPPSDTNGCHRSTQAYPLQLTPFSAGLRLRAIRACSGATSLDVVQGRNGEPGQLDSLRPDTDVVTITIGGNDVGFAGFAEICVTSGCPVGSNSYNTIMEHINDPIFSTALVNLYRQIREHATKSDAKIYIIGYPTLATSPYTLNCSMLDSGSQQAAELVGNNLNSKIYDAVEQVKALFPDYSGFKYVDPTAPGSPFIGHELCTQVSYFNQLNLLHHEYSFHPNDFGQQAYAGLIYQNM